MIGIDYCVNETLRVGMCKNDVVSQETYTVVSSDYGLLPAPTYAVAVVSIDTVTDGVYARYKTNPDPEYDECITGYSCLNGGEWTGLTRVTRGGVGGGCQVSLGVDQGSRTKGGPF